DAAVALRDLVIIGAAQVAAQRGTQHLDLLARDLRPRRVVADHRDRRHAVADVAIELGEGVRRRAIAPHQPDLLAGPHQAGTEREAAADAERAERAGIEPRQRPARPQDVARGRDEVAAVYHQHGVLGHRLLHPQEELHRIDELAGRLRLAPDLGVARQLVAAQLVEPAAPAVAGRADPI